MILVEDGLLGLNRPVRWYLPEFTGDGKDAVMVHHLLTHTSGLRNEEVEAHAERKRGTVEIHPPHETQHPRVHQYLFPRYDAPLWKPPGVEMFYCNCGYELLGEIVRRVSGRSLAAFCQERIFQPLGMVDTCYILPGSVRHRVVRRPAHAPWADVLESYRVAETPWGCGGACSTAMDMAVFAQMFLNRGTYGEARILSPSSVREMTRNQIPGISSHHGDQFFPEASWGLGWSTREHKKSVGYAEPLHSPRAFAHGGAGGVFLWADPDYDLVGVYFSVWSGEWLPPGIHVPDQKAAFIGCIDLFTNAVTAAIVD